MTVPTVNIISFLLGLLFISYGYRLVKHSREDLLWFLVSGSVGIGLIVVAVYRDIFRLVADFLGLELRARAILVVSNITLYILVVFLFNTINNLHEKISVLNEEVSLLRNELEEHDDQ
jgi:hypothetical protein